CVRRVGDAHQNLVRTILKKGRDIESESIEPAAVPTHVPTVDPKRALVVHSAEMEQHAIALPGSRNLKLAPFPQPLIRLQRPAYTGERRFHGKRNQNLTIKPGWHGCGLRRDGIVPEAVQILPSFANELRPGILAPGVRWRYLLTPCRFQRYGGGLPCL